MDNKIKKTSSLFLGVLAFLLSFQCLLYPEVTDRTTISIFGLIFLTYSFEHLAKYFKIKK